MSRREAQLYARLPAWVLRFFLGVVLFILSELFLWDRVDPIDWPNRILGCILLGALMLDLLVRFRIDDLSRLLLLAGLFGLTYGILVAPIVTGDLLNLIVLRPLGWYSLVGGALGLALLFFLMRGGHFNRFKGGVAAGLGLLWGVWVHWFPTQAEGGTVLSWAAVLALGAFALGLVGAGAWITARLTRQVITESYLMFTGWEWVLFGAGVMLLAGASFSEDRLSLLGVGALVVLGGFIVGVLVFMQGSARRSLLQGRLPVQPFDWQGYALVALTFLAGAALGYLVPPIGGQAEPAQITALISLLYVLGFLWLPATTIVMAVRAFIDLARGESF